MRLASKRANQHGVNGISVARSLGTKSRVTDLGESMEWWAFIQSAASDLWTALATETALRAYLLCGLVLGAGASLYFGNKVRKDLAAVRLEEYINAQPRIRGQPPTRPESLVRRKKLLEGLRTDRVRTIRNKVLFLVVVGIVLPTFLYYTLASSYFWLIPGAEPFVDDTTGQTFSTMPPQSLALFVLNELCRGGLLDFFEVFKINISAVSNNRAEIPFSVATLAYRVLVGGFVVFSVWTALRLRYALRTNAEGETTA